jgi:hypothetical protein
MTLVRVILVVAILSTGCRHKPVDITPLPAPLNETYCWFAVALSPLPADSVAVRFQRAYGAVGLTGAAWFHNADTAWAHAGPTPLQRGSVRATYASRVVAYWHGDSTHFRWYVATTPTADTANGSGDVIGFCGDVSRAAAVHGSAPQWPNGEDTLSVWRARP